MKEFSFELFTPDGKEEPVVIRRDKEAGTLDISAHGLTLSYDGQRLGQDPEGYVFEQLGVHETFQQCAVDELGAYHADWEQTMELYRNLERIARLANLDADKAVGIIIRAVKPFKVLGSFARGTTFPRELREHLECELTNVSGYRVMGKAINQGRNFIELARQNSRQLSGQARDGLDEWAGIQSDLSDKYSRLQRNAYRQYQHSREFWRRFYPNRQL
jgi:hypothetical protein